MIKRIIISILIFGITNSTLSMNFLRPYDTLIRPDYNAKYPWQLALFAETGISDKGFDECGDRVNVLRIWNPSQNALKMLDGFSPSSTIGQKRTQVDANDDGIRGHFNVCGDLDLNFAGAFAARYFFLNNWSFDIYFPFYVMQLKNVCWQDLTKNVSDDDRRVKEFLTNDFFANVCQLGNGLNLQGWKRTGPGDLTLFLEWFHDFRQRKPLLRNVRLNWRLGVILPTGFRRDEDRLFALPFGYDGAFALPFGIGLDLYLAFYARVGLDVQLTHIFDNTRCRRIKTNKDQTDLLLLEKVEAHKDFGLVQRFNLYAQLYKFYRGLSFLIGYQFFKRGSDTLSIYGNQFSSEIANTAASLQELTIHQIILRSDYDFGADLSYDTRVTPRLSVYARLPFNGKSSAVNSTIGLTFALDF